MEQHLRLSVFTVPDLSIGRAPLTPQNSTLDPRRAQFLEGMLAHLNSLLCELTERLGAEEALRRAEQVMAQLPYAELVQLQGGHPPRAVEIPHARDRICFDAERLRINFLDGLHRGRGIPGTLAGRQAPAVARVVSRLAQGLSEDELAQLLAESDGQLDAVVEGLRSLELIEADGRPRPRILPGLGDATDDRLTWLGHAGLLVETARAALCVDPFLRPHMRWSAEQLSSAFSDSYADRFFFDPYGPELTQLSPIELPRLDAVLVTHQDTDHCNLGVLMMLPEEVPIVVPDCRPEHGWEVDLETLIRKVLGPRRRVMRLRHGESVSFADIRVTAFPFCGEMPSSLPTSWNCYLIETNKAAVACAADSAITDAGVDFLADRLGNSRKPLVLCARMIHGGELAPGFRDEGDSLWNFTRLWAWYVPTWDLFAPVENPGISVKRLTDLARRVPLRFYLPYAMGGAPWFRVSDVQDPLYVPMANLSLKDLLAVADILSTIPGHPVLFPGKFARPFSLGEA